jgi:pimeloyl-ACP methyl ester carboxylesterase
LILRRAFVVILTLSLAIATLASAALAQDASIERRPVEDPLFGVKSVIPADWQEQGGGIYSRGTPPDDLALIAIQSAAVTPDELWPALLPQFALTEIPEVGGTHASELFDWTLYPFSVQLGDMVISAEVALAEDDGTTHLVLLQSDREDFEVLREQVLLPAVDAFATLAPEPTPDPSTFDYQIEDVAFPGGAEDVELAGTLTLPPGSGPHPVVITMSGSGPSDRDESLAPITLLKPFAVIADALTSAGVGVLRYDDRGVGSSTGDHEGATIDDFTDDARAAIDYLESRDDVDPERIGLFGHSEGGVYAAKLGATDPRVAYIGMMAPAIVDGISLIVAQNGALLRSAGESEEFATAAEEFAAEVMPVALEGDIETVETMVQGFYGEIWDNLSDDDRAIAGERQGFVERSAAREVEIYTSDWFRSFLEYDPTVDWEQVTVPVLGIFGGKDAQVLAEQNSTALNIALKAAGNEDVETITFPEANHLFQAADTGAFAEYAVLEPEFVDGFVDAIVDWMTVRAGVTE